MGPGLEEQGFRVFAEEGPLVVLAVAFGGEVVWQFEVRFLLEAVGGGGGLGEVGHVWQRVGKSGFGFDWRGLERSYKCVEFLLYPT